MFRRNIALDIRRGMMAVIHKGEEKTNCVVDKIVSYGNRVTVFDPNDNQFIEFNLRKNGDYIQISEPTKSESPRLVFPNLIRQALMNLMKND